MFELFLATVTPMTPQLHQISIFKIGHLIF